MEYRKLGTSGLEVSAIGIGGTNFGKRCDEAETARILDAALDRGVNFVDTANFYSAGKSEEFVGKALKGKRDGVVLTSKFGQPLGHGPMQGGGSRRHVMEAVEASLTRLQTEVIDLYQIHIPDPSVPIEETLRALDDLVRQGKVRYLGCSNFDGFELADAQWTARTCGLERFVSAQAHYSLLTRDVEHALVPACLQHGVGLLPFFALESGVLTGKYRAGKPPPDGSRAAKYPQFFFGDLGEQAIAAVESLITFAEARGHTMTELALAALLAKPAVSSIVVGAMSPEQLDGSLAALEWKLSDEDLAEVDRLAPSAPPRWLRFLHEAPSTIPTPQS